MAISFHHNMKRRKVRNLSFKTHLSMWHVNHICTSVKKIKKSSACCLCKWRYNQIINKPIGMHCVSSHSSIIISCWRCTGTHRSRTISWRIYDLRLSLRNDVHVVVSLTFVILPLEVWHWGIYYYFIFWPRLASRFEFRNFLVVATDQSGQKSAEKSSKHYQYRTNLIRPTLRRVHLSCPNLRYSV